MCEFVNIKMNMRINDINPTSLSRLETRTKESILYASCMV